MGWEHWIGVRGAAALGAGILVIAALYFFKYSIETGLFSPAARVVTGIFVGLGALVGAEYGRRNDNVVLANWLVGAGIAILYTAFWAAHGLYKLIGSGPAFAAMIAVTAACVTLSVRHESLVIALLGLFGGFITPFALSSGSDHPIGLFGYLLILDTALLFVGRRNRWSPLGGMSLFLTLIYQAAWINERMGPDRLGLGIGVVLLFSALFAVFPAAAPASEGEVRDGDSSNERFTQLAAVVAPFFFGLYFSLRSDLGPHLYPVGAMLGVLSIGTCVLAWLRGARWLPLAAAIGSLTVTGGWLLNHEIAPVATEVALIVCGLAAIFHMYFEVSGPRFEDIDGGVSTSCAAAVATFGAMFLVWLLGGEESVSGAMPLRVLLGWAFLSALALRHAFFPGREVLHFALALALGIFLPAFHVAHGNDAFFKDTTSWLAVVAVTALAFLVVSFARRDDDGEAWSLRAAALFALLAMLDLLFFPTHTSALVHLGVALLLGVGALIAAARLESGLWAFATALGLVFVESAWAFASTTDRRTPSITLGLFGLGLTATIVTLWPIAFARRFEEQPWAFRAAALAGPMWLPALRHLWIEAFGRGEIGLLPITLSLLAFGAGSLARGALKDEADTRETAITWLFGVSVAFVSIAIPMQLDREWITVGWALLGFGLIALWTRIDHAGLKYVGLAHLGLATVRLVLNPGVFDYHGRDPSILLNWILYTYWLPALALLGAFYLLREREVPRMRAWEEGVYPEGAPTFAMGAAGAAIVVIFVWLNLTIINAYAPGPALEFAFHHEPARDLTMSVAWAVYALVLLGLGMRRKSAALRWMSLVLILGTVGKVFLYDLSHLRDLYRVMSLVGLALSLIVISVLYQRFVFANDPRSRRRPGEPSSDASGEGW